MHAACIESPDRWTYCILGETPRIMLAHAAGRSVAAIRGLTCVPYRVTVARLAYVHGAHWLPAMHAGEVKVMHVRDVTSLSARVAS